MFLCVCVCVCVSPLLPGGVWKGPEDLFVQQRHLLEPRQLLPELHLQAVATAVLPLQMLDGADAPEGALRLHRNRV